MSSEATQDLYNYVGELLNNKYIVLLKLGEGASAGVWFSYNIQDKKYYAIKIHNIDYTDYGEKETKILNTLNKLKCPNIMKVVDSFSYEEHEYVNYCIVMPVAIGSLYDLYHKTEQYQEGLPIEWVLNIKNKMDETLKCIHAHGIMHTDVKPDNILIKGFNRKCEEIKKKVDKFNYDRELQKQKKRNKKNYIKKTIEKLIEHLKLKDDDSDDDITDDEDSRESSVYSFYNLLTEDEEERKKDLITDFCDPKYLENMDIMLSDFGYSKAISELTTKEIQTKYYRSPEIILGCKYDERADFWALGCTIYEIATGNILFDIDVYEINENRGHMFMIVSLLGPPPKTYSSGRRWKDIFRQDGMLKGEDIELRFEDRRVFFSQTINNIELLNSLGEWIQY